MKSYIQFFCCALLAISFGGCASDSQHVLSSSDIKNYVENPDEMKLPIEQGEVIRVYTVGSTLPVELVVISFNQESIKGKPYYGDMVDSSKIVSAIMYFEIKLKDISRIKRLDNAL